MTAAQLFEFKMYPRPFMLWLVVIIFLFFFFPLFGCHGIEREEGVTAAPRIIIIASTFYILQFSRCKPQRATNKNTHTTNKKKKVEKLRVLKN
jgi:hypothetical protein